MQPSTRSLEFARPVTVRPWRDPPCPQRPTLPAIADDDREHWFETLGFTGSFLIHTIVLVCLALIMFGGPPGDSSPAIVVLSDDEEPLEEVVFEPVLVGATPAREDEAEPFAPVTVGSPNDGPKQPAELTIGDVVEALSPSLATDAISTAFAPEGLLLGSVGDAGQGGGRGDSEASFYGLRAGGQKFVFVTDCSSSMAGQPFAELVRELRDSIERLPEGAEFAVIFFNDTLILPSALALEPATANVKQHSLRWIASISPDGGTDPSQALAEALKLKPSVVFLLTDGRFAPKPTWDVIRRFNRRRRVQIHTIGLGSQVDSRLLRQIAEKNRGQSRIVPE